MANALSIILLTVLLSQTRVLHVPFDEEAFKKSLLNKSSGNSSSGTDNKNSSNSNSSNSSGPMMSHENHAGIQDAILKIITRQSSRIEKKIDKKSNTMPLDKFTDKWTPPRTPTESVFDPTVYPWERIYVHNIVNIKDYKKNLSKAYIYTASETNPLRSVALTKIQTPEKFSFFWADYKFRFPGNYQILPGVAPRMFFTELISGRIEPETRLWKDSNDIYYIGPLESVSLKIRMRIAADKSYFEKYSIRDTPLPSGSWYDGDHIIRSAVKRHIGNFRSRKKFVDSLYKYFHSFKVEPLTAGSSRLPVFERILIEKRGVCRHRAILFTAILKAYGFKIRMVFNDVHAFTELFDDKGRWVRVDLGGAVLPDINPNNGDARRRSQPKPYQWILTGNTILKSGIKTTVRIEHVTTPPAFFWLALVNEKKKVIQKYEVVPVKDSPEDAVEVLIPTLKPGSYTFTVLTQ